MIINHNLGAMNAQRQMGADQNNMSDSMEKLSSGLRINRAGDDAAGLAISEKMRGQIRGLEQAERNAQDGISLIQTGEGALNETHSILQRMRELSVQSSNDTNTTVDRDEIQEEVKQLGEELDRISDTTKFNTQGLLDGSFTDKKFQIGSDGSQNLSVSINEMSATSLGIKGEEQELTAATVNTDEEVLQDADGNTVGTWQAEDTDAGTAAGYYDGAKMIHASDDALADADTVDVEVGGIDLTTQEGADAAIGTLDSAIESVSSERSKLGAVQNRLEHTINNLGTSAENLQAAESLIRDVDMAKEMMNMTKNNILSQASQSMLAQANQQPQSVLQLLQ